MTYLLALSGGPAGSARFRVPAVPVLAVLAGVSLAVRPGAGGGLATRRLVSRRPPETAVAALVILGLESEKQGVWARRRCVARPREDARVTVETRTTTAWPSPGGSGARAARPGAEAQVKHTRKSRLVCQVCQQRPAKFAYRGHVKRDRQHVLCFACATAPDRQPPPRTRCRSTSISWPPNTRAPMPPRTVPTPRPRRMPATSGRRPLTRQPDDHLDGLVHVVGRDPLEPRVEGLLTREDVRRRESHERQP